MTPQFQPPPLDQLATVDIAECEYGTELTEVVALVEWGGQGGWPATENYDVHCLTLAAWRIGDQPVVQQEMTVLRPVQPGGIFDGRFPEGSVHRFRLLLALDKSRAVFADCVEGDLNDRELKTIAAELKKPVTIQHARFGTLKLRRDLKQFEGKANWSGKNVDLSLQTDKDFDVSKSLHTAEALFADAATWERKVNDFAVEKLLDLANQWQADIAPGGPFDFLDRMIVRRWLRLPRVTPRQFLKRMQLSTISVKRDGEFEFWHSDGELFLGHSIQVSGSLADGLTQADIPG
jgi:hypothetical protein